MPKQNRFSGEYETLTDYILGITERIWEGRGVDLIRRYYSKDCVMLTQGGWSKGVEPVVSGTLETLHYFPDRRLLGEDVIWADHGPKRGLLSSHRILTTGHHQGSGAFGEAAGRPILLRAIADCLVEGDVITEEWLVRDTGAIALQLGTTPRELGFLWAVEDAKAGKKPWHLSQWEDVRKGRREKSAVLHKHPAAAQARELIEGIVNNTALALIRETYDRAVNAHLPLHVFSPGVSGIERFWTGYLSSLSDAKLVVDHCIALEEPGRPVRTSTRWRLAGTHTGHGAFGRPSGAKVLILGITHHQYAGGKISHDWTVVDELAVQRMIGLQAG